eukprot:gnl/TRDRNA2_/TRDRNA2_168212_c0_seq3.p1 gnl/TRDRNA2_/TRDRNA2_168212_c0~~gnl/TRDRNA2_/TRDRNA2_168212_c0_seq3.p1  ORF type:complete len:702 (+),score=160.25 gnl/TRDRNA2_/TRDRNA2_168212_c0_seq3:87-2108(+)
MGCCQAAPAESKPGAENGTTNGSAGGDKKAAPAGGKTGIQTNASGDRVVMGKYIMYMSKECLMGEGTSSICRKGKNNETGEEVAIKVYKEQKGGGKKAEEVKMQKFKRQIQVLKELLEPFVQPSDPTLWHEQLAGAKPARLFMSLVDYSKDAKGEPAPDPTDGVVYVITELAQYSLKDYLALRREQAKPIPKESVKNITKAIVLVVAGLHAKGLVHIDLKPENLMMFNGRLKLIDVDGCVKVGTNISIQDSSISFSPCYCAPEWARFLIKDSDSKIIASPGLDVWSIGMTICELVTLDAVLKPMYANFLRNAHSHREAGFLFMDWLSNIKKVPLPKSIEKWDTQLSDLIANWLLVCDKSTRKNLAQCLSHDYIKSAESKSESEDVGGQHMSDGAQLDHAARNRADDTSSKAPLYKGVLWKLNTNGNAKDATHWLKRDMWITAAGSLCYFSQKENKRLVLIDGGKLTDAKIKQYQGGAKDFAFEVQYQSEHDDHAMDSAVFAAESKDDYTVWTKKLLSHARMDLPTMKLGAEMAEDLKTFMVNVKNRRMKVGDNSAHDFDPVFKAKLWKVKGEGDRMKAEDWFEREMWISKNGSLVYYSKKEERELVYYTQADLSRAVIEKVPDNQSCKKFTFLVKLPPSEGVEFAPGEFAASTQGEQDDWLREFQAVTAGNKV